MEQVGHLIYFESLILCLLILLVLFIANVRYWRPVIINRLSLLYIFVAVTIVFYGLWSLVDGKPELAWANKVTTIGSSISLTLTCMYYYYYILERIGMTFAKGKFWYLSSFIMIGAVVTLSVVSAWTGTTFYIDANGSYQRGPLFFFEMIAEYSYVACGVVFALIKSAKSELLADKHRFQLLGLAIIPTVILGVVNNFLNYPYGLPVAFYGIVISLLIVYASSSAGRVTRDPLTGLLNRAAFDAKLDKAIKRRGNNNLHLMILDINRFKSINDTYGHTVGDVVLVKLSNTLENFSEETHTTVGRWGGDEFVLYIENKDNLYVNQLAETLKARILKECNDDPRFVISICVGYSKIREYESTKHLFDEADHMLYEDKQKYHSTHM